MIKFSTGKTVETLAVTAKTEYLLGFNRDVATITTTGISYEDAAQMFADGAVWSIVEDGLEYTTWNAYTLAGPITDNRDGTLVVKMGKANTAEQDAVKAQKDAEQARDKMSQSAVTLAGKPISSEAEVSVLRASFEAAAATLTDEAALYAPSLSKAWNPNERVTAGDRRYYAPSEKLYKATKTHTTNLENAPDMSDEFWNEVTK